MTAYCPRRSHAPSVPTQNSWCPTLARRRAAPRTATEHGSRIVWSQTRPQFVAEARGVPFADRTSETGRRLPTKTWPCWTTSCVSMRTPASSNWFCRRSDEHPRRPRRLTSRPFHRRGSIRLPYSACWAQRAASVVRVVVWMHTRCGYQSPAVHTRARSADHPERAPHARRVRTCISTRPESAPRRRHAREPWTALERVFHRRSFADCILYTALVVRVRICVRTTQTLHAAAGREALVEGATSTARPIPPYASAYSGTLSIRVLHASVRGSHQTDNCCDPRMWG